MAPEPQPSRPKIARIQLHNQILTLTLTVQGDISKLWHPPQGLLEQFSGLKWLMPAFLLHY